MRATIPLFFIVLFIAIAYGQKCLPEDADWCVVENQLAAISRAAQSADTIEDLNELIWDWRKFDKNDRGIVYRTKETLGKASLEHRYSWMGIGYRGGLVWVKLGDLPRELDWIEMKMNNKSVTGRSIYKIKYMENQSHLYDFFGSHGGCDFVCMYKIIFAHL